jgi:hypothetical protein
MNKKSKVLPKENERKSKHQNSLFSPKGSQLGYASGTTYGRLSTR